MPEKGSSKKKKSPVSKRKNKSPQLTDKHERQKAAEAIQAVNAASGGKNDKAAALAAAILRGVTMRPSGKWQAQLYFAGKSRYIGVFDSREKAALAYEIAREKLKTGCPDGTNGKSTENLVNAARKAAFDGVNERG
jgi:acetylglutamate kinase